MTVINFVKKEIIMSFKNILQIMKRLIVLSCFCISVSYAGVNKKNTFVELTTNGIVSFLGGIYISGGLGYKYELDFNNYFGYVLADINIGTPALTGGEAILAGKLNLEYGYEFMRDSLFSFGLNVSPIISSVSIFKGRDLSISENRKGRTDWDLMFTSSLGMFGNFNINDSFEVAIEIKAVYRFLNRMLLGNLKEGFVRTDFFPIPHFELKCRYYF